MRFFLYNIGFYFFNATFWLLSFFHKKAGQIIDGRKKSLEELKNIRIEGRVIWFHCASLGEWEQTIPVVSQIKQTGDFKVMLSFYSPSGFNHAKRTDLVEWIFYLPADLSGAYEEFFSRLDIRGISFTKYDIWPNLVKSARKRNIPLFLFGTEIRPGSKYLKKHSFFYKLLENFSWISCNVYQSTTLLKHAGFDEVYTDGSPKLERAADVARLSYKDELIESWKNDKFVILGGSVWSEEISWLTEMARSNDFGEIKIIIVPHEPTDEVIKTLSHDCGSNVVLFSQLDKNSIEKSIMIMDKVGYLSRLYRYADLALVGGGFGKGIHNIAEPAAYGIPVVSGPNNKAFSEAVQLEEEGIYLVARNYNDWIIIVREMVNNLQRRELIRLKSQTFFGKQMGSSLRIAKRILEYADRT